MLPLGPRPRVPHHRRQPALPRGLRRPPRRILLPRLQGARRGVRGLPGGGDLRRRREPRFSEQMLTTLRGDAVQVMVHTTPIRDDVGRGRGGDGDAHRHRCGEEAAGGTSRRSQERLAQLFEEVPCFISVQGADRRIQHANRKFRETFGLDAIGKHCFGVYKHREEQCLVCPSQETFADRAIAASRGGPGHGRRREDERALHDSASAKRGWRGRGGHRDVRSTSPRCASCSRSSPRSGCSSGRSRTASRGCSPASTAASTWSTRASRRATRSACRRAGRWSSATSSGSAAWCSTSSTTRRTAS